MPLKMPFERRLRPQGGGKWLGILFLLMVCMVLCPLSVSAVTNWVVVGWNNLGMHCMDNDFSVSCTLPPYNTILAQVIMSDTNQTRLVTPSSGYTVSYAAVADPDGSINKTSVGKGNFEQYVLSIFHVQPPPDTGLPVPGPESFAMPGTDNVQQGMKFETPFSWFVAYGVPITPYDDQLRKNTYPMMRLVASNAAQQVATADIVLPVSDEMVCRACHSSGGAPDAWPAGGWFWDPDPRRDYRLNPIRLHDEKQTNNPLYATALAARGFDPAGLYATVVRHGQPILCAACHLSEALPNTGFSGIKPLTAAIHRHHAGVRDPVNGQLLGSSGDRAACYRCHPGSDTRCLRGAMGSAVAPDGTLAMQCQDCHGSMDTVGDTNRTGWLEEPDCQACHTGDAVKNNGQIRYDSVYVTNDAVRAVTNRLFATNTNAPAAGLSLFRFSRGHGGLYCEACHGSTHAEFPSAFRNDNIYSEARQGHKGPLSECTACHMVSPATVTNGPHGLHPVGAVWIEGHQSPAKNGGYVQCAVCHGADYRGTVLSRSMANRTFNTDFGQKNFWRGYRVGCYACHVGPTHELPNTNQPAVVSQAVAGTTVNTPVVIPLHATDPNGDPLALRIVSQPSHGRVGLAATNATYIPDNAFFGVDRFTFAAWDGSADSNLATGTVSVAAGGACAYSILPAAQAFDELSHVSAFNVVTSNDCTWTASSMVLWLQVLSGGSAGSGTVLYGVDRNAGSSARTGTVSVAGLVFTVTQAGAPPDLNNDGLPDAWQIQYFGSTGSVDAAYGADPDKDGANNDMEYLSSTVPTNDASVLRITAISSTGTVFVAAFPTVSNHYYYMRRTDNLVTGAWEAFTNAQPGTGGTLSIPDNMGTNVIRRFYRARMAY